LQTGNQAAITVPIADEQSEAMEPVVDESFPPEVSTVDVDLAGVSVRSIAL